MLHAVQVVSSAGVTHDSVSGGKSLGKAGSSFDDVAESELQKKKNSLERGVEGLLPR